MSQGDSDNTFSGIQLKAISAGGSALAFARAIVMCLILLTMATAIVLMAIGSKKSIEEGKEKFIRAAIGIFLTSVILFIVSLILVAIE